MCSAPSPSAVLRPSSTMSRADAQFLTLFSTGERGGEGMHVGMVNLAVCVVSLQDVKDNNEEATKMAPQTLQLCKMVSTALVVAECSLML